MWVINDDLLYSVPDDAPVPRGAKATDLPEGFLENPGTWTLQNGAFVKVKPARPPPAGLTADDITRIKAAIKDGRI